MTKDWSYFCRHSALQRLHFFGLIFFYKIQKELDSVEFIETNISGVFQIRPKTFFDQRGSFVKHFNKTEFKKMGLKDSFQEDFFSISKKNVIRGFHFQTPPHDHDKLVYCQKGKVFDVVLDLRKGSPTYGKTESFVLDAKDYTSLYISSGIGHAFMSLEDDSLVMYKVSSEHSSSYDMGIRWDSVNVNWPMENPIISQRDSSFPRIETFNSPFNYRS